MAIGVAAGLWGKVQATKPSESSDGIRAEEILSVMLNVPSSQHLQVARAQAALIERLRRETDVRAVTFATALPRMDHPIRLMDIDQDAAVVAPAAGPFKVRTARIAIDFFDELQQPLVAGRGSRSAPSVRPTRSAGACGKPPRIDRPSAPGSKSLASSGTWVFTH